MTITDQEWAEIAAAGDGMPSTARDEVAAEVIKHRHLLEHRKFEVVGWMTKKLFKDAQAKVADAIVALSALERNEEYRCFNTGGTPVAIDDLTEARMRLDRLVKQFTSDEPRFRRKSARQFERNESNRYVKSLLEIQAKHLSRDLPCEPRDRRNCRFEEYLKACGSPFDANIDQVIRNFNRRKKGAPPSE